VSKHKSNVHPDYYKTAGREPQGRDVVQSVNRQAYANAKSKEQERFFRDTAEASGNVPEAGSQASRKPGPVLLKKQTSPGHKGRTGRSNVAARRAAPLHSHRFTIGDRDAVETLMNKLKKSSRVQANPEKLRKAFETAMSEFRSTDDVERKAFVHGLLTGYGVGVKLGQEKSLSSRV